MSARSLTNYAFYAILALILLYRGLSLVKSDMFSVTTIMNSFKALNEGTGSDYNIMKVSSAPIKPLHPPNVAIGSDNREEL